MGLGRYFLSVGDVVQDAEADVFRKAEAEFLGVTFYEFALGWSRAEPYGNGAVIAWHERRIADARRLSSKI